MTSINSDNGQSNALPGKTPSPPWRPYLDTLKLARIGIAIALVVCLLLNIDQALECLIVLAQDFHSHTRFLKLLLCFGTLSGLALMLWYWARALQYKFLPDDKGFVRHLRVHLPRIVGVIPFVGMLIALVRIGTDSTLVLVVADSLLAVAFYAFCVLRRRVYLRGRTPPPGLPPESRRVLWATAIFMLVAALVFTLKPQWAQGVGALAVVLSAAAGWVVVCGALTFWGDEHSVPVFWILLAWLAFWSFQNTNDDHQIRPLQFGAGTPAPRPTPAPMEATFDEWLKNRQDLAAYGDKPYPVIVIAAEGGGMYAAYHTALALAELQDIQPAFAQHVFAISGVSGGSVGASVFTALMARTPPVTSPSRPHALFSTGPITTASQSFFDGDFLAPLIAKAVYPDLLQRFNVFPYPKADRARALEQSLEQAWVKMQRHGGVAAGVNPFDSNFEDLWSNFPAGATPALLLNTTEVETGRQMVLSNLGPAAFGRPHMFFVDHPDCYIRLSTASVLSARFPIVTPAGREMSHGTDGAAVDHRYVDGGYFENSGIGTLYDVVAALLLHRNSIPGPARFRLIVLRIGLDNVDAAVDDGETQKPVANPNDPRRQFTQSAFEELGSPIRTLLNTRAAREEAALAQMHGMVDPPQNQCTYTQLLISDEHVTLPLGWLLSEPAKDDIQAQIERPTRHLLGVAKAIEP